MKKNKTYDWKTVSQTVKFDLNPKNQAFVDLWNEATDKNLKRLRRELSKSLFTQGKSRKSGKETL